MPFIPINGIRLPRSTAVMPYTLLIFSKLYCTKKGHCIGNAPLYVINQNLDLLSLSLFSSSLGSRCLFSLRSFLYCGSSFGSLSLRSGLA